MRYTRVALYDIKSGTYADILGKAKTGLVPLFEASPGFESLGVAEVDKNSFVSVSTWKTREQADAASMKAADWLKSNSRDQFALRHNYIGDLTIDTEARESAGTGR
jgi:heme-degrading monooxygenase HmoA